MDVGKGVVENNVEEDVETQRPHESMPPPVPKTVQFIGALFFKIRSIFFSSFRISARNMCIIPFSFGIFFGCNK